MSVLHIVGPYPPPYGGVSVHIQRMLPYLEKNEIDYILYDQYFTDSKNIIATRKKISWWFLYLFKKPPKVVHFHQFSVFVFFYAFIFSYIHKSKVIVSIHNENIINGSKFLRFISVSLIRFGFKCHYIVVSEKIFQYLRSFKLNNVEFLPAYVPPVGISEKILNKSKSGPIVLFNAWRLDNFKSDVYGFDILLEVAKYYVDFNFYCFVGDSSSGLYVRNMINRVSLDNINVIVGENLVDYMANANLFLRLNREDAYGVSVKEALDLGVPAIASDVCDRAMGAILFESGSLESLIEAIEAVKINGFKVDKRTIDQTNFHFKLIQLYQNYLGK